MQAAGLLVLAQLPQNEGKVPGRNASVEVVVAQSGVASGVGALEQRERRPRLPSGVAVGRGPVEEPLHLVGYGIERPVRLSGGQNVG